MRIDYSYIAKVLSAFVGTKKYSLTLFEMKDAGIEIEVDGKPINKQFIFHMSLMFEMGLIRFIDGDKGRDWLSWIGIEYSSYKYVVFISRNTIDHGIRLTQKGRDFERALINEKIIARMISDEFKDYGPESVFYASQRLLEAYSPDAAA